MKFLCDQMLARLGRWLRAAGYDTAVVVANQDDREILAESQRTKRILITRDREFQQLAPQSDSVIVLQGNSLRDCIQELSQRLPINWLHAPLTRCLVCNELLRAAGQEKFQDVPDDIQLAGWAIRQCSQCRKSYWEGSHSKRIMKQLTAFADKQSEKRG